MMQRPDHMGKDVSVKIRMDIAVDLPVEMADKLERLGIIEFEQCTFDESRHCLTASVTTTLYRKGA